MQFDAQLFDILTFQIFKLKSMRYKQPIWEIIKEKAPASMAIQIPAFLIADQTAIKYGLGMVRPGARGLKRWNKAIRMPWMMKAAIAVGIAHNAICNGSSTMPYSA